MANDFIVITRTNRPQAGTNVISAANQLKDLCDAIKGLNKQAGHMHDGVTYTTVEAQFGLAAGAGANFLTLLGYLDEILNTTTDVTGANRFARIEEFASRLSNQ